MNLGPMTSKRGAHANKRANAAQKANRVWDDIKRMGPASCGSEPQPPHERQNVVQKEPSPPVSSPLSEAEREYYIKRALTRFVRNKTKPEELETLRYNLIAARVMAGLTAVEAAERFGYANSTQLSLIESGGRPTPKDWKFLRQAARVYACSTDFLLGLSPHIEFDAKVAQQHALMRRTEDLVGGIASQLATALIRFSEDEQITAGECERLDAAAMRVDEALTRLRDKHGFDDMPGGAPLAAAVEQLSQAAVPVRRRLKKRQTLRAYIEDVRAGRLPLVGHIREHYSMEGVRAEVLGKTIDEEDA